jgi:hypothetical protein
MIITAFTIQVSGKTELKLPLGATILNVYGWNGKIELSIQYNDKTKGKEKRTFLTMQEDEEFDDNVNCRYISFAKNCGYAHAITHVFEVLE